MITDPSKFKQVGTTVSPKVAGSIISTTGNMQCGDPVDEHGVGDKGYNDLLYAFKDQKLDDFGEPDDNTDLDATILRHGLLPKLGGGTTNFFRADGIWAAPPGGGGVQNVSILCSAESCYLPATNPATMNETNGVTTFAGWSYLAFGDTVSEHAVWRVPVPDYDGGNIVITAYTKPATTPAGAVTLQFNILTVGLANSEAFNQAVTVDTGVNISQSMNTTELDTDVCVASATIDPANVAADDLMVIELSRDVTSDNLVGDGELLGIQITYTRS